MKMCRPIFVNGQWQNRYNCEIYNSYEEREQTRNIMLRRFQWVGHVIRMIDESVPKK
jgi:hypothetical protein